MVSGNYILGRNLSLDGFADYVEPHLADTGIEVPDRAVVPYKTDDYAPERHQGILVSVTGDGELTSAVHSAVLRGVDDIAAEDWDAETVEPHQLAAVPDYEEPFVRTLGTYADDSTASDVFGMYARQQLAEDVDYQIETAVQTAEERLEELLDTPISQLDG